MQKGNNWTFWRGWNKVVLTTFAIILLIVTIVTPGISQDPPNILFIICDDLNASGAIFNGDPQVQIPNLEALAERGVNFVNARANTPICSPSRASLHSGLYASTTGYYGYEMNTYQWQNNPMLNSVKGMYQHLNASGYEVYGAGKVYHNTSITDTLFQNYNDDVFSFGPNPWDGVSFDQNGNPELSLFPGMPEAMQNWANKGIGPLINLDDDSLIWAEGNNVFHIENDSMRDATFDERSLNYAKNILLQDHDSAFALAVGFVRPHTPLYAPPQFFDLYQIDELELPGYLPNDLADVSTAIMNTRYTGTHGYYDFREYLQASVDSTDSLYWAKRMLQGYYASITYMDSLVGELIDALDSSAYAENTIVVFTSDHGWHTGHKESIKKNSLWDICTRIPFIAAGPGIAIDQVCEKPISLIDVYPTIVDLAQVPSPVHQLDGYSITPLLADPQNGAWTGPDKTLSMVATHETGPFNGIGNSQHQHFALTSEQYNYTHMSSGEEELYDLINDPQEWINLVSDTTYSNVLQDFRQELVSRVGIVLEDVPEDRALFYGNFEQGFNGWFPKLWNGAVANFDIEEIDVFEGQKAFKVSVQQVNPNSLWDAVVINPNLVLENNETYRLSFMAKTIGSDGTLKVQLSKDGEPDWSAYFVESFELNNSWTEYIYDFTFPGNSTVINARLYFHFADVTDFLVDDVQIRKVYVPDCVPGNYPDVIDLNVTDLGAMYKLSWQPILGSIACQVNGGVVGAGQVTITKWGNEQSFHNVPKSVLVPGATYQWRVRCGCQVNPIVVSPWSDYNFFVNGNPNADFDFINAPELTEIKLYPNPSKTGLFYFDAGFTTINTASLFSSSGQLLQKESLWDRSKLDYSNFPKGLYIVRFDYDEGYNYQKIIMN